MSGVSSAFPCASLRYRTLPFSTMFQLGFTTYGIQPWTRFTKGKYQYALKRQDKQPREEIYRQSEVHRLLHRVLQKHATVGPLLLQDVQPTLVKEKREARPIKRPKTGARSRCCRGAKRTRDNILVRPVQQRAFRERHKAKPTSY